MTYNNILKQIIFLFPIGDNVCYLFQILKFKSQNTYKEVLCELSKRTAVKRLAVKEF